MKLFSGFVSVDHNFVTIDLPFNYAKMVVVTTPVLNSTNGPAVVTQVRNAAGSSFELRLFAPEGTPSSPTIISPKRQVHYVVVEEGEYQAYSGIKMSALRVNSATSNDNTNWLTNQMQPLTLSAFAKPVVLGQVMTVNNADWTTFWACGIDKDNVPNNTHAHVGKHCGVNGDCRGISNNETETLGVIVVESGNGNVANSHFITDTGDVKIKGVLDANTSYAFNFPGAPTVAIASISTMLGGNGGWAVLDGASPITSTTINLAVDEDIDRSHTAEAISYLIFEKNACLA